MTRRSRYAHPETFRVMTLTQIAHELGISRKYARRRLRAYAPYLLTYPHIRVTRNREVLYDAAAVEVIKAVMGQPHRVIPPGNDWLTPYEGAEHE